MMKLISKLNLVRSFGIWRSVTVGSGLLKKETAEAYGWLLRAFRKA
ncbi:hypothetical protein Tco_0501547, partial [Tanacetum coccineum]